MPSCRCSCSRISPREAHSSSPPNRSSLAVKYSRCSLNWPHPWARPRIRDPPPPAIPACLLLLPPEASAKLLPSSIVQIRESRNGWDWKGLQRSSHSKPLSWAGMPRSPPQNPRTTLLLRSRGIAVGCGWCWLEQQPCFPGKCVLGQSFACGIAGLYQR